MRLDKTGYAVSSQNMPASSMSTLNTRQNLSRWKRRRIMSWRLSRKMTAPRPLMRPSSLVQMEGKVRALSLTHHSPRPNLTERVLGTVRKLLDLKFVGKTGGDDKRMVIGDIQMTGSIDKEVCRIPRSPFTSISPKTIRLALVFLWKSARRHVRHIAHIKAFYAP